MNENNGKKNGGQLIIPLSMLSVAASANTLSNTITVLLDQTQAVVKRHNTARITEPACMCSP